MPIRRFGDVAVNPDSVVCVSRKVAKMESEKDGDDGGTIIEKEDRSSMIMKTDGSYMHIEISESAADDLLDYFQRTSTGKPQS